MNSDILRQLSLQYNASIFLSVSGYTHNANFSLFLKLQQAHIDEMPITNLTADEKDMVDGVLFELGVAAEHETGILYRQGLKDCVWILKSLGVLA